MPAKRVCPTSGCPELVTSGRCDDCKRKAEAVRGSASQRGYNSPGHRRFRHAVLHRDPLCVCPEQDHGHESGRCLAPSTVADHHPLSRRELIDAGLNPNSPERGRGLCAPCHGKYTTFAQPGGWNQR